MGVMHVVHGTSFGAELEEKQMPWRLLLLSHCLCELFGEASFRLVFLPLDTVCLPELTRNLEVGVLTE